MMSNHPYRSQAMGSFVETDGPVRQPYCAARSRALRYFVQAVRNARMYEALATKLWRGEDDKPKPHFLVSLVAGGTIGLASSSMATVWWQAAWQFAEIRWLTSDD